MKKILACVGAFVLSAALFLLLPQLASSPPERGAQPLGIVYMVFPAAALFYGALIPFACFEDRYVAVIEGAIFVVFAWAAGWRISAISLGGTAIYALLMLGGALVMTALRYVMPIRFKPTDWRKKAIWAMVETAGLAGIFLCRAFLRPEFITTMRRDTYDFDYIFLFFPLFALAYGGLLPLFSAGDTGFMAISLGGFAAVFFVVLCCTNIAIPWISFILLAIALAAACVVGWLKSRLTPPQT